MKKELIMQKETDKVPVLDLYHAAWLELNGIAPEFNLQGSRVVFQFQPNRTFYQLSQQYNLNPPTPVLDFVAAVRKLRAQMLAAKGAGR
jgi:hypothetical protein